MSKRAMFESASERIAELAADLERCTHQSTARAEALEAALREAQFVIEGLDIGEGGEPFACCRRIDALLSVSPRKETE